MSKGNYQAYLPKELHDRIIKIHQNIKIELINEGKKGTKAEILDRVFSFYGNHKGMIKTKESEKEINGEIITEQIEEITDYYKEPDYIENLQIRLNNSMKPTISKTSLTRSLWDDILNIINKENDNFQINPKNVYNDIQKYINILREKYIAEKTL